MTRSPWDNRKPFGAQQTNKQEGNKSQTTQRKTFSLHISPASCFLETGGLPALGGWIQLSVVVALALGTLTSLPKTPGFLIFVGPALSNFSFSEVLHLAAQGNM